MLSYTVLEKSKTCFTSKSNHSIFSEYSENSKILTHGNRAFVRVYRMMGGDRFLSLVDGFALAALIGAVALYSQAQLKVINPWKYTCGKLFIF